MLITKKIVNDVIKRKEATSSKTLQSKAVDGMYDVFLSYNHNDDETAHRMFDFLVACGFSVYADWIDHSLNRNNVSSKTAQILKNKMKKCKGLLYLHSEKASGSKWCPWEVGFFSGLSDNKCANFPLVKKQTDEFRGQEYLGLYPYLSIIFDEDGGEELRISESVDRYVSLRAWLNGERIRKHKLKSTEQNKA